MNGFFWYELHRMKIKLLILFLIVWSHAFSQTIESDTVMELNEVVISAKRIQQYSAGLKVQSLNLGDLRKMPGLKLSDVLSAHSGHFVKTYGAGGLATLGIRGTAPQHTAVFWNGFNINPPNIAMADISMLPLFLFNNIELVSGGSSTITGSGAIGGSILLNSQNGINKNQLSLATQFGQYGDKLTALKAAFSKSRFGFSTAVWFNSSENNFKYENIAKYGKPVERLTNADAIQFGLLQEAFLKISDKHNLKAGFWMQEREAGIPPSMTMAKSIARQLDRMLRGYLQWNIEHEKTKYLFKSGYHYDFLNYIDSLIDLRSEIHVGIWNNEANVNTVIAGNIHLTAGAVYQLHHARTENYTENKDPQHFSVFMLATRTIPELHWTFSLGARKEYASDHSGIPPALSLGWKGKIAGMIDGRMNISSNYRIPTLNDRFWVTGGNPDLKAETSINFESGADFTFRKKNTTGSYSITIYANKIKNWITWLPADNFYWKPENIGSVIIIGFENSLKLEHHTPLLLYRFELSWNAGKSLYEASSFKDIKHKPQLIYTPVHNAVFSASITYRSWELQMINKITGSRFTDRTNTNKLPAYYTGNFNLAKRFKMKRSALIVNATVNNFTNHAYQVIEYRPMPGRTFHLSLIFDLLFDKVSKY
jgi:iron complex outermembrane receptor protein